MNQPAVAVTLSADMTVLDVIQLHRRAEAVFKALEKEIGQCICCEALFDTLEDVSFRYGLDQDRLMDRLKNALAESRSAPGD